MMTRPLRMVAHDLHLALAPLQLTLDGFADEGRYRLLLLQNRFNARLGAGRETARYLFFVDLCSAHEWNIDDITYCYKR